MARVKQPLNDTQIKKAKAKDKNYTLSDGQGLQLLIKTNGSKLWEFRYTSPITLKAKKTSLGTYPTVSLKVVRDKRMEYQELIIKDIDPIEYFKQRKKDIKLKEAESKNTIGKVVDDFIAMQKNNKGLKDITLEKNKGRIENHFIAHLPLKENTPIKNIDYIQIIEILKKLEEADKLTTLVQVKGLIFNLFLFAYSQNISKDSTIHYRIKAYTFKQRAKGDIRNNPALTKKEDIQKLYKLMNKYEHNLITKYLLIFSIHTAQRQGSIIKAKWCDIDLTNKLWTIPSQDMKTKKEHTIPLSDVLIKYLQELQIFTGQEVYLFPNTQRNRVTNKYPYISNNTVRNALRLMGYKNEDLTAHGLRATFKTICKEHQEDYKLSNEYVERILSHKVGNDVENAYNRALNLKEMSIILNWWSNYLESLL